MPATSSPASAPQPPNDPHAITREQLVQGLRKCLTATAKFSEVRFQALVHSGITRVLHMLCLTFVPCSSACL